MFNNFRRWLNGEFICTPCGKLFHLMSFGFGDTVCPRCYSGKPPLVRLDKTYILNRILANMTVRK